MALLTYLFAFAHFSSEILIFRTARLSIPVLSPVIVSSAYQPPFVGILRDPDASFDPLTPFFPATSLVWMIAQYEFYVKA